MQWKKPAGPVILALVVLAAAVWGWQAYAGRRARPVVVPFTDVTRTAGITFQHTHGGCGERYFPEMFSSGCAFFDYDGDGYLDIYLVNGAPLPGCRIQDYQGCRLYHNNGNGTFTDVTASAGVGNQGGYGLGCCVGDYDNDGRPDLYVTNYGANRLYHNDGDGRFTDVATRAGVQCHRFSTSCAFADYDNDGYLDLFVCNYADYKPGDDLRCRAHKSVPSYCRPTDLNAQQSVLFHNNGDGTFTDVSRAAGIVVPEPGRALGVVWSDLDNDGDPDLYVANDQTPNFLFRNNGNGTFTEVGRASGVAVNGNGRAEAGMGVDAGDWNHTGYFDLFVTNFSNETNTLYHNQGQLQFTDMTERTGLGEISLKFLAFGTAFFDFDLDGNLDLFVANGHVWDDVGIWEYGITYPERAFLFHNDGRGHFDEVGRLCGKYFATPRVGRGAAIGDYDNDGDLDLLVNNSNQTPNLLRNDLKSGAHWIQFQLTGTRSNRSAIGARVQVTAGGLRQMSEVRSGSSYCSQNDLRLTFGLGRQPQAEKVTIRWPAGEIETLEHLAADRLYRIREGAGAEVVVRNGPPAARHR